MTDPLKIVAVGDDGAGKSSMISAFVAQVFPEKVPPVLAPVEIPAQESVTSRLTVIVDSSPTIPDLLLHKMKEADSIILVYDLSRAETYDRLKTVWLPKIRDTFDNADGEGGVVEKPVILVGNKCDLLPPSTDDDMTTIKEELRQRVEGLMTEFRFVLQYYDCSARTLENVPEVFEVAQKLVVYPLRPLFDMTTTDLTPKVQLAFRRIFRIMDLDHDGLLSDDELNRLQKFVFQAPLAQDDLKEIKKIVEKGVAGGPGVVNDKFTLQGFYEIIRRFCFNMQVDMPWEMLKKFEYDKDINLTAAMREKVEAKLTVVASLDEEVWELSTTLAIESLKRMFDQYATGGRLGPAELARVMDVLPDGEVNVWDELAQEAWLKPDVAAMTGGAGFGKESWVAAWQLAAVLSPVVAARHLILLGCGVDPTKLVVASTNRHKRSRHKKPRQPHREQTAFQSLVFGATGEVLSAFARGVCGSVPPPSRGGVGVRGEWEAGSEATAAGGGAGVDVDELLSPSPLFTTPTCKACTVAFGERTKWLMVGLVPDAELETGIDEAEKADIAILVYDLKVESQVESVLKLEQRLPKTVPTLFVELRPEKPSGPVPSEGEGLSADTISGSPVEAPHADVVEVCKRRGCAEVMTVVGEGGFAQADIPRHAIALVEKCNLMDVRSGGKKRGPAEGQSCKAWCERLPGYKELGPWRYPVVVGVVVVSVVAVVCLVHNQRRTAKDDMKREYR